MRRKATGATNKSPRFSGENSPGGWTDCKFYISLRDFLLKSRQSSSQSSIVLKFVTQILFLIEKTFGEGQVFGQRNFFSEAHALNLRKDYF